ncbi:glycoside hydrolase family 57 protein [Dethiobacter alkaliphilus]|uniref:Glycoside hydrolase family 57 n=1 Tax=Dethiobacter alkaliphilus AHT 1 TaxID=555088 RepID=C0GEN1_DETAL|nr:glycoside hydrolase family 57 protein [Dethiobacter alkaliphilus]EEG78063.1 glycoside hydrolase family 57 [Dethiobacter alkaliphilus AHT 1]
MKPLYIAFVWNQHQPYYLDTMKKEYIMPWVRLHATKDYYQMAAILREYPQIRQTFNLTPSLVAQLDDYLEGADDYYLRVMKPVEELSAEEKRFLLSHYFDIHWERVIGCWPRYSQLLSKQGRCKEPESVEAALARFTDQDYLDLQVWFNLAWIDPEVRQKDEELSALQQKGQSFSEEDKALVLKKQWDIIRQVVPVHKELAQSGQIELITTPFYHPIVPLLIDSTSALRATPGLHLPSTFSYPEDAAEQTVRAVNQYRRYFDGTPSGIWPPEQAVSPEALAMFADHGFDWTITDEDILARSLNCEIYRDGFGHVLNADELYRPYLAQVQGREIAVIFRDHHLSDRIGFVYHQMSMDHAVDDLIHRFHKIRESVANCQGPHLVTLALDGENAWEWYPGDKQEFLHKLYSRLSQDTLLRTVTVSEFLQEHPPGRHLENLHSGSWVDHSVTRWIGSESKNRLWQMLLDARQMLERVRGTISPERLMRAKENLLIAEGSDYTWWVDSMPYYLAAPFEALFRKHLANAYRECGVANPPYLDEPVIRPQHGEAAWVDNPLAGPTAMVQAKN